MWIKILILPHSALPQWQNSKEFTCSAGAIGDAGWIPGSGRSPGGGQGDPLQYSCLETPMDRGVCPPAAAAKSLQSCPTLCDPIDGSPPSFPVPGILKARILEWVAISFSNASKWKVKVKSFSCVWLLLTSSTAAYQAPPSWDFPGKSTGVHRVAKI